MNFSKSCNKEIAWFTSITEIIEIGPIININVPIAKPPANK